MLSCFSHLTTFDPMNCSSLGSSVHGFSQARILESIAMPSPEDLPDPKIEPMSHYISFWGFPDSSVGKEFTCNAGDPALIPGSGRSPGEVLGYPIQYSWASLATQLVKTLPAMWETWVRSLGWEEPLEKGKATHSSILTWRIPWVI